jgi:hypothetical protein
LQHKRASAAEDVKIDNADLDIE